MRICFIGDSFVNGTGDPECLGWSGRICSAACKAGLDVTYYNLGIRRDTSHDIAARWQREAALRLPPDVDGRLVFSFGVNDCTLGDDGHPRLTQEAANTAARSIFGQAGRWLPTLMIGPPPIGEPDVNARIQARLPNLAAACAEGAIPFLDVFAPLSHSTVWMREVSAGDGAHPGAAGYSLLAELIMEWAAWQSWVGSSSPGF